LDYSSVQHFAAATQDKCETKFDEMMVALKRIIQKWEASGQGDGSVNDEVEEEEGFELKVWHELGSLRYHSHHALAHLAQISFNTVRWFSCTFGKSVKLLI
jgi:hypothetical protein